MKKFGTRSTFFRSLKKIAPIINGVYELTKIICRCPDTKTGQWYGVSFYFRKEKGKDAFLINEICVEKTFEKEDCDETISRLT